VLGGGSGADASALACTLAVTARRRGLKTLLIDGDPASRGIDRSLGLPLSVDASADAAARIPGALAADAAAAGDLAGSLAVLSFDGCEGALVPPEAMAAALQAGRRGRDLVVVYLAPTFHAASLLALTCADRGYLLVMAEMRACAAASRVVAAARRHCPALGLVVRAVAGRGLLPREVAEALDLPLAGVLPPPPRDPRTATSPAAEGRPGHGPLAQLCRRLVADVISGEVPSDVEQSPERGGPPVVGTVWK
jgi:hypothetical protein